jgi:hypothetical protein
VNAEKQTPREMKGEMHKSTGLIGDGNVPF